MKTAQNTPLTIVMTVYNDEQWLREAIESVLKQTYRNFIFFISDDCSTDASQKICEEYAAQDPRIVYIRQPKNLGGYRHTKLAFENIHTPFAITCSGHDVYHPQFLEKVLPLIQDHPDIVIAYSKIFSINYDRSLGEELKNEYDTTALNTSVARYLFIIKKLRNGGIAQGIWRSDILKNTILKPVIAADVLVIFHAALEGKFKQYPEVLFWMRYNRPTVREWPNQMYRRQYRMVTGRYPKISRPLFLAKNKFIYENLRLVFKAQNLGLRSKLRLLLPTLYYDLRKFYLVPALFPLYYLVVCKNPKLYTMYQKTFRK